jgi:3-oxoadipate enol-lactonase
MDRESKGYNLTTVIKGLKISYDDLGEGSVPIIFLHGYPFDKTMWNNQVEELKTKHRVIAIDIRGFGRTTDEESHLSIDLFVKDLIAFMDKLEIPVASICGLSMGGYIALKAVHKFPKRFVSMIVCDTQCIADTAEQKENRFKTIEEISIKGKTTFNDHFLASVFYEGSYIHQKEMVEMIRKIVLANTQHIIKMGLRALAERTESCASLSSITIPVLIICGKNDSLTPVEQSEYMHKAIKTSILHVINAAGHVSNLDQPIIFNQIIKDFLNN